MAKLCGDVPGLGPCLHDPLRRDAVFPTGRPCDGFCILTGSAKYRLKQRLKGVESSCCGVESEGDSLKFVEGGPKEGDACVRAMMRLRETRARTVFAVEGARATSTYFQKGLEQAPPMDAMSSRL